jgi:WD40 repeat protein
VISDCKIISGSYEEIKVWDVESGLCLQTFDVGHTNYIKSIIQISNEKIASCDLDGKIIIWNIENGDCLKTIEAHSGTIWNLAKLSNNKIISCSEDKTIKVWDVNEGICLKTLNGQIAEVLCLDLSN